MKLSTLRTDYSAGIRAAFAVALCCGGMQAASLLTAAPGTVALTCNTITGPGSAATIVVKPVATLTSNTMAVALSAFSGGLAMTPPVSAILNSTNQSQGLTYTVNLAAGCAGASSGSTTIRFYAGGVADVQVTVSTSVTASASALVASPVTLTCVRNAGPPVSYTPGPAQTAPVTSAAEGGTPFTLDASKNPPWLAVTPTPGGIAGSTGVPVTMSAVSPCGNYLPGSSNMASIHLRNLPAPDGLIPVTLQVIGPSPVTATPGAPSLSYTKGSPTPAFVDVALAAAVLSLAGSRAASFAVDTASLPAWLTVDAVTGTVPKSLHFTTTSVADTVGLGSYSATVRVQVSGFGDLAVPFRLTVSNPAPKLTAAEGTTRGIAWAIGQPLPIPYITLASSGSAIPYTIVTGGTLAPIISASYLRGFAYNYDTPIPVTFDQSVFAAAQPGSVLTGTVTITWGAPASTTVITINITVQPAAATLLAVSPLSLPTAASGQTFTVALTGTGFVASSDPAQGTVVGIVSGGLLVADANIAATVVNASNVILTITVPVAADPFLPFSPTGSGGTVTLGVCNPLGAACTISTGVAKLLIVPGPVIQAVTSASAYLQSTPPALPTVAPYDMVSLFGTNFCTSYGTGCAADQVLHGMPDPSTLRYPAGLSPDASGGGQRFLTVAFQTHTTPPVLIANAPLLFATNGQINLLVPSAVSGYVGKSIDVVVNFGYPPAATIMSSAAVPVNVAAADPGVFTVGSDGQGEGAVLGLDWSLITTGNEAAVRQNPADSDTVQIYMTGLGAPDGAADNAGSGNGQWPVDCVTVASYLSALNQQISGSLASVDGALIESRLLNNNRMPPCLRSASVIPTVTIGGQPATVTYAGWVANGVAGEYQVNVRLPGSTAGTFTGAAGAPITPPLTAPVQMPVVVTARGRASQPGVTMWVAPRLKVTGPAGAGLRGAVGVPWSGPGSLVTATEGTVPYKYAVSRGSLPAGLTLDPTNGAISGTPAADAAGSYTVTVTASDSAAIPLTGSAAFTLTIAAGH
jgi:uncharacterized protein (TIGR03437 family)